MDKIFLHVHYSVLYFMFLAKLMFLLVLQGLVDYEGGDSDEEEEEGSGNEVTKRPRLS